MKKIQKAFIALLLGFVLAACGTTAFTGRKQFLMYSDESVSALSDESYSKFMKTAVISKNTVESL